MPLPVAGLIVDTDVLRFFVHHRQGWLTMVARVVTTLGSSGLLIPLVIVAGLAWRVVRHSWRGLLLLAGSYAGGEVFFQVLKVIIGRARPPSALAIGHFTGMAFPSGHATLSVAVWGMLAALIVGAVHRAAARSAMWAGAALIALLVGLTRLYLGAHWLTDVLAGWVLGALWVFALLQVSRRWPWTRSGSSSHSAFP